MELVPIEYGGQRVLTTQQLAEGYGTEPQIITNNYNRNKDRYRHGVHYFALSGDEKKAFINLNQFDLGLKNAATIYLWTEKGALYHAKSLNTDRAWEVYDQLVETYFRVTKNQFSIPQTYPEALRLAADLAEQNQRLLPKAQQFDKFLSGENYQDMKTVAKVLGLGYGRNTLFKILRDRKILMSNNTPYQQYIDAGYFVVKEKPIQIGEDVINKPQTFVTAKGVDWLSRLLEVS